MTADSDDRRGIRITRVELLAGAGFVLLLAVGVLHMLSLGYRLIYFVPVAGN